MEKRTVAAVVASVGEVPQAYAMAGHIDQGVDLMADSPPPIRHILGALVCALLPVKALHRYLDGAAVTRPQSRGDERVRGRRHEGAVH